MELVPTKHNSAQKSEIAQSVIMTGDPIRCANIAKSFLTNVRKVNDLRKEPAFTGEYKGKQITIMSSGMGNASMGIYSYELFNFYKVKQIIRIGTCGTNKNYKLGDIIISKQVITDTNYMNYFEKNKNVPLDCGKKLLKKVEKNCKAHNLNAVIGTTFNTDSFYENTNPIQHKCDNVEMESASLYINAKNSKKQALCICVVTDLINCKDKTHKDASGLERQKFVKNLVEVALESSI